MKRKLALLLIFSIGIIFSASSQNFSLGDQLFPTSYDFERIGISSKTGVISFRYKKLTNDRFFGRILGDVIVGIKKGRIVQTVYLMIPESTDYGVPSDIINLIQSNLPFPLTRINGGYGVKIDNYNITISRNNDAITFYKDRIMYFSSINQKLLEQK